jgi:iron complex outermembrane receptor protein
MNKQDNRLSRLTATTAMGVVLALGAGGAAFAQTQARPAVTDVEEVVVTATGTSIRGVEAVGSETVKVDREAIVASGLSTPVEVIRTLPQVQGLGFDNVPHVAGNGNGNLQRGTSISIRGLQSNATLVLIDGKRIAPTGNVFSFTEANQLPVSAIDRIDVVADGASAIYGSDAVAGVVNFIPRKNFEGLEVSGRYRTNKYFDQSGGAVLGGHNWDSLFGLGGGHIVASIDYDKQDAMLRGASGYLRQDLRAFGGNDGRINGNTATSAAPGNILVAGAPNTTLPNAGNFTYYGVPSSGPITAATLRVNQPNLFDSSDNTDFMPATKRYQAFLYIDQEITPNLTVYYEGYYNRRKSELRSVALSGVRTLPSTSPYYVAGIPGLAPGAPETISFSFLNSIGQSYSRVQDDSQAHTVGARLKLPHQWTAEASFTNSFDRLCSNCVDPLNNNVNANLLQAELNNGNLNPFSTTPIPAAELAKFIFPGYDQSRSILDSTQLRFDGPLFDLPGGTVKAAFGGEHMDISGHRTSRGIQATSDTIGAQASRDVDSLYGELFVPVVGSDMSVPFVQSLMLDLAIRTEKYSDFGRTTNPKIGGTWTLNDDVQIRGAWGKSFRAPNLIENNPAFFSRVALSTIANGAKDASIPVTNVATGQSNVVTISGSNADLTPEKATNYSFGIDYKPHVLPGLELSATYYNIEYTNQIIGLQTAGATYLATAANRALYAAYITPAIQPSTCVNGQASTYNPLYQAVLSRPSLTTIDQSNFCSASAITTTQNANAATTKQDGVDLLASYRFETGFGAWTPAFSGTKIIHNRQALAPGAALTDALDSINNPISLRYRLSLAWRLQPFTANLALNHVGSYTNNLPITVNGVLQPSSNVGAWDTADLSLSYETPETGPTWTKGVRATLTILNLTGRKPPTVLSANGGAFDQQSANIFGRQYSFQISKRF